MFDYRGYGWVFWEGVQITILVGLCAAVVAILMGLIGAWGKLARSRPANLVANAYTTIVRGIPELVLILLVYYGVTILLQRTLTALLGSEVLIDIDPFTAGVLTLGVIYGAFATEVFRGAFLAIPKGQIEAAYSFGMSRVQTLWRIMLPQVWRFALPGLGNVWLVLIKATALMSVIQLEELLRWSDIGARNTKLPFTFYLTASFIYLGITVVSMLLQHRAEVWANRGIRRA
ncbi:ABC transporter permease [Dongia deserti]|uniref:ABC transporter permease n=1 Tax=Dongia deserti TaxID=2268030 RepID=UPI000E647ACD|nr:ABC transporter permease [Dongia deserti]